MQMLFSSGAHTARSAQDSFHQTIQKNSACYATIDDDAKANESAKSVSSASASTLTCSAAVNI